MMLKVLSAVVSFYLHRSNHQIPELPIVINLMSGHSHYGTMIRKSPAIKTDIHFGVQAIKDISAV